MAERIDYRTYINSDDWKLRRVAALQRASDRSGPKCEMCGRHGGSHKNPRSRLDSRERQFRVDGSSGLEVHHLHYSTLGAETPADLVVLCTDIVYYDDYDRIYRDWSRRVRALPEDMRHGLPRPVNPERIGCHERTHDDPVFRAKVAQLAERRSS